MRNESEYVIGFAILVAVSDWLTGVMKQIIVGGSRVKMWKHKYTFNIYFNVYMYIYFAVIFVKSNLVEVN